MISLFAGKVRSERILKSLKLMNQPIMLGVCFMLPAMNFVSGIDARCIPLITAATYNVYQLPVVTKKHKH